MIDRKPIYDAIRVILKRGLEQSEVDILEKAMDRAEGVSQELTPAPLPAAGNPRALGDAPAFYAGVRAIFGGSLEASQVEGLKRLLQAFGVARWPLSWVAYALATSFWETNRTMQPVREAYWLSEDWRKRNLRYYPWYGRGYVQLTWEANYKKADAALELGGAMVADPDKAMDPEIAARVMVWGMQTGAFTGKGLPNYLTQSLAQENDPAGFDAFKAARQIINGRDKDDEIAGIALHFQNALVSGEWA